MLDHIPAFCHCTFVLQVPHVQDGSQQLGDLPVLRVGEHKDLHRGADVGVLLAVISAIAGGAVTLGRKRGSREFTDSQIQRFLRPDGAISII